MTVCIKDRLRVLSFVNGLLDTGTESGHVRQCEHGAHHPIIASCVRGNPKKKPPVPVPNFTPPWCPVSDHLGAQFLEIHHVREHTDGAGGLANMRWREAKRRCRGPVEAGDREVAPDHDDGKIDRF
jgi:hypothetical protein